MSFGLGRLAWAPDVFWSATPREIAAALHFHDARGAGNPPERDALARLMATYPDE